MSKYINKIVERPFEVTTTEKGKVFAQVGDTIVVSKKGTEFYNIHKVGQIMVYSRWMRKNWVDMHCKR